MIRVLLVDDSALALLMLKRMVAESSGIQVVGTARHGAEAMEKIPDLRPDVICTDFHMPIMDGLQFTREVMRRHPMPILVVSVSVQKDEDDENIFALLEAGALDVFPKPQGVLDEENYRLQMEALSQKIRILSGVQSIRRHRREKCGEVEARHAVPLSLPASRPEERLTQPRIVAVGASTGGPQALQTILTALPDHYPFPLLCVQHISEGFVQELVRWLNKCCLLPVRIASFGEIPKAGVVYFPPEKRHLVIGPSGSFERGPDLSQEPHCPSVTVLFRSLADYFGSSVVGVLLTGMGRDGADGMQAIHRAGGLTIAQNEESCVVFGMPQQAIALEAVRRVLSIDEIARTLSQLKRR